MYEKIMYFKNWGSIIRDEIQSDNDTDWYHPAGLVLENGNLIKGASGSFVEGRMKFINRNLNYFYIKNMIKLAYVNNYTFNPKYIKSLEFCNYIRSYIKESGPFGRMCIWKLSPNCIIKPHIDNFEYHRHIMRYIFCISPQRYNDATIIIKNQKIEVSPGLLFNFYPYSEIHEFRNNSDTDWFFLGFDYWNPDMLISSAIKHNISSSTIVDYSIGYGTKMQQYMSIH